MNDQKFSIVIPAYNEAGSIEKTLSRITEKVSTPHEIIVVNDCSTDKTSEIVAKLEIPNLRLVNNEKNKGFVKSLLVGFSKSETRILLPVMADNCDEYDIIDEMYRLIEKGYDMVSGSRYIKGGKRISTFSTKSFFSRFVSLSVHIISGIPTHDISNSFKMFRKEILSKIEIESKGFELSVEIPIKAFYLGYKITEIPTIWLDREADESKFNNLVQVPRYFKWIRFAILERLKISKKT